MKNKLPAVGGARQPRAIVQVGGFNAPWLTFEVDNNVFYAADTFRVTFPASALSAAVSLDTLFGAEDVFVEIFAGFPADPDNYTPQSGDSLIYGRADEVSWSLDETEIEISGRDLTARFIDAKSSQKYPNLTASAIVEKLARDAGLNSQVKATTTKVGKYYEIDHVRSQDSRTLWDLITWLAREEGFIAFVQGQTLYFQPAPTAGQDPYVFQFVSPSATGHAQGNVTTMKVTHAKTLAKDVIVKVHSWNRKQAKGFTKEAKASHTRSAVSTSGLVRQKSSPQVYEYTIPNLTPDAAQARAFQLLAEISKHEMRLEVTGPADNLLQRTDVIQVQGTRSPVDAVFFPSSIVRRMAFGAGEGDGGYTWTVEAKNKSPESQVSL